MLVSIRAGCQVWGFSGPPVLGWCLTPMPEMHTSAGTFMSIIPFIPGAIRGQERLWLID